MRIVFDLDDTICKHEKRDFKNAQPVERTIKKIKEAKKLGAEIIIYTARGQNSCAGNLKKIKEKYEEPITKWLKQNNVPFDELRFGKPLADLYVDDKGISLESFLPLRIERLKGNSGATVYILGDIAIKECSNAWDQYSWYKKAEKYGINVPNVKSVVLDTITMERCGEEITELTEPIVQKMISTVYTFKRVPHKTKFRTSSIIKRVDEHLKTAGIKDSYAKTKTVITLNESLLKAETSFSHGDFSVSNCLKNGRDIYVIDPNQKDNYSSYLLDFAKLKFSMNGGEKHLKGKEPKNTKMAYKLLLSELKRCGILEITTALEVTHWLRLLKYAKDSNEIKTIKEKAAEIEKEL